MVGRSNKQTDTTVQTPKHSMFADFMNALLGRFVHLAASVAIGIATARIWGADGRGLIAIVMVWPGLMVQLFELGVMRSLPHLIGRSILPIRESGKVIFTLWAVSSFVAVAVTLALLTLVLDEPIGWPWMLVVALWIPAYLFASYGRGFALAVQKPRFLTSVFVINAPLTLCLILLFGAVLGYNSVSDGWFYILSLSTGYIAVALLSARLILKHTRLGPTSDLKTLASTIKATIKFGIGGLVMRLIYYADILLLGLPVFLVPNSDIGNYTVGVAAAALIWQIPGALGVLVHSRGAVSEDMDQYNRQLASTVRGSIMIAIPFMVIVCFLAPLLFPLVYGPEFTKSGAIVQILSPAILAFFGARIYESGFNAHGINRPIITIMGAVVIANVALNILLIPEFGIYGAAWASAVTYPIGSLGLGIAYARRCGMSLGEVFKPQAADLAPAARRLKRLKKKIIPAKEEPSD